MGRKREFDLQQVLLGAEELFARDGYEGSSMDRLVQRTGLHRGSLYGTFGSKRGLFVACLRAASAPTSTSEGTDVELLLVALMELSWRDAEVRALCADAVSALGEQAEWVIGRRLLDRAALTAVRQESTTPRTEDVK